MPALFTKLWHSAPWEGEDEYEPRGRMTGGVHHGTGVGLVGACVAGTATVPSHFVLLLLPMPQPCTLSSSQSFPCLLLPF